MIQIALSAFLVWAFFHFKERDGPIDGFTAMAFILVPAIIVFLATMGIMALGAPHWPIYLLELSYFIVPFLFLKSITDYTTTKIVSYSAIVLVINIITQVLVAILIGLPPA